MGLGSGDDPPVAVRVVEDRWATIRHAVESAAIVAAGLWAFYIFIYQEKIKPAADPASLTTTIDIARLGRDAKRDIISINIRLENSGKTEIDIAADAYNVWGERYGSRDAVSSRVDPQQREFRRNIPRLSATLVEAYVELRDRAAGGVKGRHIIIEPGSGETVRYVVVVPRGEYDALRAQVINVPVKTSTRGDVDVGVESDSVRGVRLIPRSGDSAEDDIDTRFALIP